MRVLARACRDVRAGVVSTVAQARASGRVDVPAEGQLSALILLHTGSFHALVMAMTESKTRPCTRDTRAWRSSLTMVPPRLHENRRARRKKDLLRPMNTHEKGRRSERTRKCKNSEALEALEALEEREEEETSGGEATLYSFWARRRDTNGRRNDQDRRRTSPSGKLHPSCTSHASSHGRRWSSIETSANALPRSHDQRMLRTAYLISRHPTSRHSIGPDVPHCFASPSTSLHHPMTVGVEHLPHAKNHATHRPKSFVCNKTHPLFY